jgi:hypothetical protein
MEMIGGDVGEGSKMLEVWRVAVLSGLGLLTLTLTLTAAAKEVGASYGRVWFLELCEKWEPSSIHGDDVVNKKITTNKILNPFFRRFLVFEKYLLMLSSCDSLFS